MTRSALGFLLVGVALICGAHAALGASTVKTLPPGAELHANLVLAVDSGVVKPGSKVTAIVVKNARIKDVTIPRDAKLIGQVTAASRSRPATAGGPGADAELSFVFDRAEVSAGREVALRAIVVALAPRAGGAFERYGGMVSTSGIDMRQRSKQGMKRPQQTSPSAVGGLDSSGAIKSGSLGVFDLEALDVSAKGLIVSTDTQVKLEAGTQMLLLTVGDDDEPQE